MVKSSATNGTLNQLEQRDNGYICYDKVPSIARYILAACIALKLSIVRLSYAAEQRRSTTAQRLRRRHEPRQ